MAKLELTKDATAEGETFHNRDEITLGVLTALERDANMSQRMISSELGVALGLANSYLKRCVRKGWVKIQEVPRRRYAYYLTPQGFTEKARLTGNYLSASFTFFRRATNQMSNLIEQCVDNGWKRVAFAGVSELAEVGLLCAQDFDVTIVGIVDPSSKSTSMRRLPVTRTFAELDEVDAVIVTELLKPLAVCEMVEKSVGPGRTLIPGLLNISSRATAGAGAGQAAE